MIALPCIWVHGWVCVRFCASRSLARGGPSRETPAPQPPEGERTENTFARTYMLAGAFTSGKGLKETPAEKKERLELAELSRLLEPPAWAASSLHAELRAAGKKDDNGEEVTLKKIEDAIMRCSAVAKLEPEGGEPFWAVLAPASRNDHRVVCLGQTADHRLVGAVAFYPASHKESGGFKAALRAADATRVLLIDGEPDDAMPLGHPTVVGIGENGAAPYPASSDMTAPPCLHLAEAMHLFLQGKALVNARLQRGGASAEEKALVQKRLLREASRRMQTLCKCSAEQRDYSVLNRVESAVGGLRKMYLKRPEWDKRCLECGTRHTEVEKGTCKFWRRWADEAKENEEAEAEVTKAVAVAKAQEGKAEEAAAKEEAKEEAAAVDKATPPAAAGTAAAAAKEEAAAAAAAAAEQPSFVPFMPQLRRREMAEHSPEKENTPEEIQLS